MAIDSHAHFGQYKVINKFQNFFMKASIEEVIKRAASCGVEISIVSSFKALHPRFKANVVKANNDLLKSKLKSKRIRYLPVINPLQKKTYEQAEELLSRQKALENIIDQSKPNSKEYKDAENELEILPKVRRYRTDFLAIDSTSKIKTLEQLCSKVTDMLPTVITYESSSNQKMFLISLPKGFGLSHLKNSEHVKRSSYIKKLRKEFLEHYGFKRSI